jgi:hypothetical protein
MVNMTTIELYDWFAGLALGGLMSNPQFPQQSSGEPFDQFAARVTDSAYRIAEAMMKEGRRRKKDPGSAW